MSVPLDAIATHDTNERIKKSLAWQDYHRRAREELDRVLRARQQQEQKEAPGSSVSPTLPLTPKASPASVSGRPALKISTPATTGAKRLPDTPPATPLRGTQGNGGSPTYRLFPSTPTPGKEGDAGSERYKEKVVAETVTETAMPTPKSKHMQTPVKVGKRIKELLTPRKKIPHSSITDEYNDIRRAMSAERIENTHETERPRTADPNERPHQHEYLHLDDCWDWHTREMYARRPLPPLPPLPKLEAMPGVRSGRGAVAR